MAFVSSFCGASLTATTTRAVTSVRPSRGVAPATRMSMVPVVNEAIVRVTEVTPQLLAAQESDFGGYTLPALGLLTIGVIIAVLTPPVKE